MASNPPGKCCVEGFRHEGVTTGQIIKVAGKWDGYLAVPPADKEEKETAILYIPDIYGIWQNSQLLADRFAAAGYPTLVLDVLNGDPVPVNRPADFDTMKWLAEGTGGTNPHTSQHVDPIVEAGIKELKNRGAKRIGSVGYCFGAKYVARHYKSGIDVGYMAHPSFVEEEELASITGPLAISAAETDSIFPAEKRHKSEEILLKNGHPYQIALYSGVSHGFAVRCDESVRIQRWSKEQAFYQAVAWFKEFLSGPGSKA